MSSSTRIWPSQAALAPIPMVGIAISLVRRAASGSALPPPTPQKGPAPATARGAPPHHPRKGPARRNRAGILLEGTPVGRVTPLRPKAAKGIDRLRGEPDMRH